MTSKEKTEFRKQLLSSRPLVRECCGTATKRLAVHHMDPEHYTDLNPDKFSLLCSMCHKCVSRLERISPSNWGKYNSEWAQLYNRFVTVPVAEVDAEVEVEVAWPYESRWSTVTVTTP